LRNFRRQLKQEIKIAVNQGPVGLSQIEIHSVIAYVPGIGWDLPPSDKDRKGRVDGESLPFPPLLRHVCVLIHSPLFRVAAPAGDGGLQHSFHLARFP